jgi:hypothetical protein
VTGSRPFLKLAELLLLLLLFCFSWKNPSFRTKSNFIYCNIFLKKMIFFIQNLNVFLTNSEFFLWVGGLVGVGYVQNDIVAWPSRFRENYIITSFGWKTFQGLESET